MANLSERLPFYVNSAGVSLPIAWLRGCGRFIGDLPREARDDAARLRTLPDASIQTKADALIVEERIIGCAFFLSREEIDSLRQSLSRCYVAEAPCTIVEEQEELQPAA